MRLARSSIKRFTCFLLLLTPGLFLLHLALTARFGPLEGAGIGIVGPNGVLLAAACLLLCYGVLVHDKAARDQRKLGRPYAKTLLFLALPTVILVVLTAAVGEFVAGQFPPGGSAGLIFPPNSSAGIRTSEFEFTININSIGIRDHEIDPRHKRRYRIVAIGDSFTNGWGVEIEECWPKVLERALQKTGRDVEVLNLGVAGASPREYAWIAQRGVRILQPDLVLVAVLQGDDVAQLLHGVGKQDRSVTQRFVERLLPNLYSQLQRLSTSRPSHITSKQIRTVWQQQVRSVLENHRAAEERQRWENLAPALQQMYTNGDLNPGWLRYMISSPDFFALTFHTGNLKLRRAVDLMAEHFRDIRIAGKTVNAKTVVISVPFSPYVSRESLNAFQELGFQLDEAMLTSDAPDAVVREACRNAGVEFHAVTSRFRKASKEQTLFFKYDGHFNPRGHALYGEMVSEVLQPALQ